MASLKLGQYTGGSSRRKVHGRSGARSAVAVKRLLLKLRSTCVVEAGSGELRVRHPSYSRNFDDGLARLLGRHR
ncbi:unnamed protein product [Urochloa humidicola]